MRNSFKVIGVGGYKDSGKTEVAVRLIEELVKRGHRVGTVKHIPHPNFTIDVPGTDTWRHARAGSEVVVALSPGEVAVVDKRGADLYRLLLSMRELDFIVLEGFKRIENVVKVMVARDEREASELDDEFTAGFVGEGHGGKPVFQREDIKGLADFVEERATSPVGGLNCGACGYETCKEFILAAVSGRTSRRECPALEGWVKLRVNGRELPLNPFVQRFISGTIAGMLTALRGASGEEIEIKVRRRRDGSGEG